MSGYPRWDVAFPALLALACTRPSYLEIQLSLPTSPVDLAQQVEWLDLAASDGTPSDAGPRRIPSAPVAGGLGVAYPKLILAVSAPAGSQVDVMINGLDAAGNPIGSASGSKLIGPGTSSLSLTLSTHCESPRQCDPNQVCSGIVGCDADSRLGFGACIDENLGVPDAGTPCGPSDAGHCDGMGICRLAYCGDGMVDPDAGEQCDWGAGNSDTLPDHCRTDCQLPHCGDGVVDPDGGEICDFDAGHNGQGLGCNATCDLLGEVTTLVADAGLGSPYGLAVVGDSLYVADTSFHLVRRIDLASRTMQTMAGGTGDGGPCPGDADGVGVSAAFCQLNALLPFDGGVLISDQASLRLLLPVAALDAGAVSTLAGSLGGAGLVAFEPGPFATALYGNPHGMTQIGDVIYTNAHSLDLIAASSLATRQVSLVASVGSELVLNGMTGIGSVAYTSTTDSVLSVDTGVSLSQVTTLLGQLAAYGPDGLCTDGKAVMVCMASDRTIRQIDPATSELSLVAGESGTAELRDGLGVAAGFFAPVNCAWDPVRRALYISDGQTIRMIQ